MAIRGIIRELLIFEKKFKNFASFHLRKKIKIFHF
uniref:Uncharacterized protein n=1 Tax=Ciona intestinalis TaxID=7719 RepID=H2XW61_CIOIN